MGTTVAIIGGGYGGAALAKALDPDFEVVLIDPKDSFEHAVAALRGLVSAPWAERMYYGFDRLLTRGRFVRGRAASVDEDGVTLADGSRIEADFTVLASGSSYPYPAKSGVDDTAEALLRQADTRDQLALAQRVLLIGGGPVGLEFAGEIAEQWPDKRVTVLDSAEDILGGQFLPGLRTALREQLDALGVQLVLGSPLIELPPTEPGRYAPFSAFTEAGDLLAADIWFRCHGVRPNSVALAGALAGAARPDGFVEVDDRLRIRGSARVFAIGDITALPEPKRSKAATDHAVVAAANIRALAAGRPADTAHRPGPAAIIVPLGSTGGASQVPGPDGPVVLDAAATAQYKGGDLLTGRYQELFSAGVPTAS
ncbi:FAD-dependent oxidoreductase [Kitasatospora phosalacinea]|uniref:FAD-dependent oxidoreductase n=1 Tax=Kitasatospora phosalacinea TaxID=2065 RepID=A0ABW6GER5_9ACTN